MGRWVFGHHHGTVQFRSPYPSPILPQSLLTCSAHGDNMADSIIEKIRKAAEARDKAINEQAQKGFCAPCDEPLESCMCDAYEAMAGEE